MADDVPALRIDPTRGRLPKPSADLFEKMARAGYAACHAAGVIRYVDGNEKPEPEGSRPFWEQATEDVRDAMLIEARAMYAEVAKAGGARVEVIKEQGDDD